MDAHTTNHGTLSIRGTHGCEAVEDLALLHGPSRVPAFCTGEKGKVYLVLTQKLYSTRTCFSLWNICHLDCIKILTPGFGSNRAHGWYRGDPKTRCSHGHVVYSLYIHSQPQHRHFLQVYAQARAQFTTSLATGWSEGTLHSEIPAGMCSCAQMRRRLWRPAMTSAGPGMQLSTTRLRCTAAECTACVAATATTSWRTSLSRSALQDIAPGTSRTLCAPTPLTLMLSTVHVLIAHMIPAGTSLHIALWFYLALLPLSHHT